MKKARQLLLLFICADLGGFLARSISIYVDYRKRPGLYEMWSAPWYTGILTSALAAGLAALAAFAIYLWLGYKIKKKEALSH